MSLSTTYVYPSLTDSIDAILYSHSRYPNPEWKETHPPRADIQKCVWCMHSAKAHSDAYDRLASSSR